MMSMVKLKIVAGVVAVAAIIAGAGENLLVAQNSGQTDTEAPTTPKGPYVYVSPPVASRIDVFWYDSKDNTGVAGYHIYRDGKKIATVEETWPHFSCYPDTNLSPATKYTYTVTAFDKAGNESRHTEPVSATTRDKPAPNLDVIIKTSRTSGVAPLSVFFDVTDTGSFTDGSFVDATCAWNFDVEGADPKGKYRHVRGFVAAHVFEKPGTYKVRCDVYDVQGRHDAKEVTIKVEAFSGRTYYVAANGVDNNPGTMEKPVLTVAHALNNLAQPNTRILFRKGDEFRTTLVDASRKGGPVIVGSYSDPRSPSDQAPIIHSTQVGGDRPIINLGSDWRVMDLRIRSGGATSGKKGPNYPGAVNGGGEHGLMYRLELDHFVGRYGARGRYNTMAECNLHHVSNCALLIVGTQLEAYGTDGGCAIIGNWVHDMDNENLEHVLRLQGVSRYFIAFNKCEAGDATNGDNVTIRGDTDRVVLYKNILDMNNNFTPQQIQTREYVHHCVAEANLFVGRNEPKYTHFTARFLGLGITGSDIVVRNNIFYNFQRCVGMGGDRNMVGPPWNIRIYNNTAICMEQPDCVFVQEAKKSGKNIFWKNNLMLSHSAPRNGNIFGQAEAGKVELERNVSFSGSAVADSKIANIKLPECANVGVPGVGLDEADFAALFKDFAAPSAGSPVINAGTANMGKSLDFHGNLRDDKPDIGAIEYLADKKPGDKPVVTEVKPTSKPLSQPVNPDQVKPAQNGPAATNGDGASAGNGNGSSADTSQTTAPPVNPDDPETQAKRRLSTARIYIATDPAKAKELLRKVITDYPDTETAKEARKELNKLN